MWLAAVVGLYLALSVPVVAHTIAARLPPLPSSEPSSIDTVVVLDGDNGQARIDAAVNAFKTFSPRSIIVIGDPWISRTIAYEGVPRRQVVLDSNPPNTRSQIARLQQLVTSRDLGRAALIASRVQMPRVHALMQRANLSLVLIPSPMDREPAVSGLMRYVPTYAGLCLSRDALYEFLAVVYYRREGWI
jgi:uncharacterized SAM-binding protein YcdF (DUF218 family)